ncbi:MAG: type IV toxin-antitoxin system AbiEi family antitoxin domain-containing protein [Solirubrobacteraceae bacterium]
MRVLGFRRETSVSGTRDERIAAITRHQCGRLARRQLIAAGISSGAIVRAVKAGRLVPEHRGVYAVPGSGPVPLGAETAALLAVRDGAVLSHHTAAAIWGLRSSATELIHVLVAGSHAAGVRGARVHRTTALDAADISVHRHLPAARTTAGRTPNREELVPPQCAPQSFSAGTLSRTG